MDRGRRGPILAQTSSRPLLTDIGDPREDRPQSDANQGDPRPPSPPVATTGAASQAPGHVGGPVLLRIAERQPPRPQRVRLPRASDALLNHPADPTVRRAPGHRSCSIQAALWGTQRIEPRSVAATYAIALSLPSKPGAVDGRASHRDGLAHEREFAHESATRSMRVRAGGSGAE
jgi:hypothetical protein